jgi:hypothetical protein
MTSQHSAWVIRRVVRFAPTEADQALLEAVEAALAGQFHGNFSALCKQALRQLLLPGQAEVAEPVPAQVQAQLLELQARLARLEQGTEARLVLLEQRLGQAVEPEPEPEPEIDPLLSRLAPLLEDF